MFFARQIFFSAQLFTKHYRNFSANLIKNYDKLLEERKMALPKHRETPIIMRLETENFKSIFTEELIALNSLFLKYGYEIRIAGGAVRDLLMNKRPKDLDFATTATPDQMKDMFTKEAIRMINTKGEKHGTITPRINDKENFEVTTLRIDVLTDGRHAEVQFTTDWLLDASRRDLTINAMYLDLEGSVYDYFYGYEDLKAKRVVFVGEAAIRIQEDYLRILRYFRFYGRIVDKPNQHESNVLEAIRKNIDGLENVSGERIWMELKQILEGNFAGELLLDLLSVGVSPYIGLNSDPNVTELEVVWERSKGRQLSAIALLSSLLRTTDDVLTLHNRLKLSAYERDLALFIVAHRNIEPSSDPVLPFKKLVVKFKGKISNSFEYAVEVLKYNNSPYLDDFKSWTIPKFPVSGTMLKEKGVPPGKVLGDVLNELKNMWIEKNFNSSKEDLLKEVPRVTEELAERKRSKKMV